MEFFPIKKAFLRMVLLVCLAASSLFSSGQLLVGKQPFSEVPLRYSIDIFPIALGYKKGFDIEYWHGMSVGIGVDTRDKVAGFSYGAAFRGLNSGGVFVGPLFNTSKRTIGISIDLIYSFVTLPLKISFQRSMSGANSNATFFTVYLSVGVGVLHPMFRLEDGHIRHILEQ